MAQRISIHMGLWHPPLGPLAVYRNEICYMVDFGEYSNHLWPMKQKACWPDLLQPEVQPHREATVTSGIWDQSPPQPIVSLGSGQRGPPRGAHRSPLALCPEVSHG